MHVASRPECGAALAYNASENVASLELACGTCG